MKTFAIEICPGLGCPPLCFAALLICQRERTCILCLHHSQARPHSYSDPSAVEKELETTSSLLPPRALCGPASWLDWQVGCGVSVTCCILTATVLPTALATPRIRDLTPGAMWAVSQPPCSLLSTKSAPQRPFWLTEQESLTLRI